MYSIATCTEVHGWTQALIRLTVIYLRRSPLSSGGLDAVRLLALELQLQVFVT